MVRGEIGGQGGWRGTAGGGGVRGEIGAAGISEGYCCGSKQWVGVRVEIKG